MYTCTFGHFLPSVLLFSSIIFYVQSFLPTFSLPSVIFCQKSFSKFNHSTINFLPSFILNSVILCLAILHSVYLPLVILRSVLVSSNTTMEECRKQRQKSALVVRLVCSLLLKPPPPAPPGWLYFYPTLEKLSTLRGWKGGTHKQLIATKFLCFTIFATVMRSWRRGWLTMTTSTVPSFNCSSMNTPADNIC
jgi:hypothetical protein